MQFKPNKRLYIVFNPIDQTPLGFSDDQFSLDDYSKESPVPVYTKKVAKKLMEVDELSRKAKGWPAQPLAMAPINLPFEYRHRPLTHEEVQEDKDLQETKTRMSVEANQRELDWFFDNLEALAGRRSDEEQPKNAKSASGQVMIFGRSPEGCIVTLCETPEKDIAADEDSPPLVTFLPGDSKGDFIPSYTKAKAEVLIKMQRYDNRQKKLSGWEYFTIPVKHDLATDIKL